MPKFIFVWFFLCGVLVAWAADDGRSKSMPEAFAGYPQAPAFTVAPRPEPLPNYPCSMCHQFKPPDPQPRKLAARHPELNHGKGRLWCMECHHLEDRDQLRNFRDEKVGYEQAYLVCGQCHFSQQKDWFFGAHGKRVGNWQGARELYNCVHCHNPHDPAIQPRAPQPPPPVRAGLKRQQGLDHGLSQVWERQAPAKAPESTDE